MIQIENVSKKINNKLLLNNIEFSISEGIFGLLGHNGAGKTTLMRIMATLLPATDGDIRINGISVTRNPEKVRKFIGYLPQHFHAHPQLRGIELLDYVAVMKGITNKKARRAEITKRLEEVNLSNKGFEKIKTYSHGMKQRLGIAQAFIGNPSVVLLDEPTVGLDPEERLRFRRLIAKESKTKSIILSTHVITDVEACCYDLALLNKGSLLLNGTVEKIHELACGKVWEAIIPINQQKLLNEYQTLFVKEIGYELHVRLIAEEKPFQVAKAVTPTLEDGLFYVQGGALHA